MTVNTGVSPTLRRPQTFHQFTYQYRNRTLVPLPIRIALVGCMGSAGTAVPGTVYEVTDAQQTDGLFAISSELAMMCRMALNVGAYLGRGPRVFAVAVAEPGSGVAGVQTITVTGTATADGVHLIDVAGRPFAVGVRLGDVQNTVATSIANALKTRQAELPVTVSVATNVVSLTMPHKGAAGLDVVVDINQQVPGSGLAVATTAVAAGAYDITAALDALAPLPFDAVAIGNHASADIADISSDLASRWSNSEKRWRYYYVGERGSIGTATALSSAANHQSTHIVSYEGARSTGAELAAAVAFGANSRDRPNANYSGMKLPVYGPPVALAYTPTEVETAIAAGLTAMTPEINQFTRQIVPGVSKIERLITTKTTENSQPFEVLRDTAVSRTGVYFAQQLDAAWAARTGGSASGDGMLLTDDTIDQVRDMVVGILREMEEGKILRDVDHDLPRLVVERAEAIGRIDVDVAYTVVVGLQQIAYLHRVQV